MNEHTAYTGTQSRGSSLARQSLSALLFLKPSNEAVRLRQSKFVAQSASFRNKLRILLQLSIATSLIDISINYRVAETVITSARFVWIIFGLGGEDSLCHIRDIEKLSRCWLTRKVASRVWDFDKGALAIRDDRCDDEEEVHVDT